MTHLRINVSSIKARTKAFSVYSTHDNSFLGSIYWWGRWRCYIFQPTQRDATIWSDDCLKEISDFLTKINHEHKIGGLNEKEMPSQ